MRRASAAVRGGGAGDGAMARAVVRRRGGVGGQMCVLKYKC